MAQLSSRNKVFSDIDLDFDIHPNTKRLNTLSSENSVLRSLRNLIMTNHYERPFHPELGCGIRESLFDNIMDSTAITIRNRIQEVINNFEPRINLKTVDVIAVPEENGYNVIITFFIVNEAVARQTTFFLERIR